MDAITIVGAGGIGCAVGYAFAAAGANVTFVDTHPDKVIRGRSDGVAVDRRPTLPAKFVHFDDWRPDPGAVVWLCTKCYDNAAVLDRLPAGVTVVPVQNGFDLHLDARGHAAEGIASFVSKCKPDRPHTRITRKGSLHLGWRAEPLPPAPSSKRGGGARIPAGHGSGYADPPPPPFFLPLPASGRGPGGRVPEPVSEPRLNEWAALLRKAGLFRVVVVPDIRPYKHTKLMYNAAISPLAAAAGLDNGQLLAVALARRLFFRLLLENHAILTGAGLPLGKVGPLRPATVAAILRRPAVANALAWAFYPGLRGTYCSMAGDLATGRTELDNYTGHLLRLAGDRPCPLNRRVYDVVKRLERRREVPGVAVLRELED